MRKLVDMLLVDLRMWLCTFCCPCSYLYKTHPAECLYINVDEVQLMQPPKRNVLHWDQLVVIKTLKKSKALDEYYRMAWQCPTPDL